MSTVRPSLLLAALLTLTGCASPPTEPAEPTPTEVAEPTPEAEAPAPAPVEDANATQVASIESRVEQLVGLRGDLEEVRAPVLAEGDLEQTTVGYRKGQLWVVLTQTDSLGDYGTETRTYVMDDGSLIHMSRSGHAFDDSGEGFVYFDEEVALAPSGDILRARRREVMNGSSGLEDVGLSDRPWHDLEANKELLDPSGVLALLDAVP